MQGASPTAMLPSGDDVGSLAAAWVEHEWKLRAFIAAAEDVQRVYEYRTLIGQAGASSLQQIVTHLVNHGSYHRGQVTTLLWQMGSPNARQMDHRLFTASPAEPAFRGNWSSDLGVLPSRRKEIALYSGTVQSLDTLSAHERRRREGVSDG